MTAPKGPKTPAGLAGAGARLWRSIVDEYALDCHEELLLLQACRTCDRLDRLDVEASDNPVTVVNMKGDRVSHPALVESRQQSLTLARLLASLRLPSGEEEDRPQRRGAARGSYGIRGVV
jgi:hypothetical protein